MSHLEWPGSFWEAGSKTQHLPNTTNWIGSLLSFIFCRYSVFLDTWPALSVDQPQHCKLSSVEVILVHSPFTQRTEAKLLIWFEVGWLPCHGAPDERISIAEKYLCTKEVESLNPGRHLAIWDVVALFGGISKWPVKHLMSWASFISWKKGSQP